MLDWLQNNLGTVVVSLLLAGVIGAVLCKLIRDKKRGKSSCSCGCANCAMSGTCHGSDQTAEKR